MFCLLGPIYPFTGVVLQPNFINAILGYVVGIVVNYVNYMIKGALSEPNQNLRS